MPKGRGANARRRTARQIGHLLDEERADALVETVGQGYLKVIDLYASSTTKAEKRQAKAAKVAKAKRKARKKWLPRLEEI